MLFVTKQFCLVSYKAAIGFLFRKWKKKREGSNYFLIFTLFSFLVKSEVVPVSLGFVQLLLDASLSKKLVLEIISGTNIF
ncbi:hypothetical protein [uncultured Polaribacter sp.]|uniref:hypothetical protein n=1 Tax=uncultured Polaribacter sp. TaxID=174711 RepID=UPI0026201952|nr:hypothetical protein [uncultured Polaribacter sp.]